MINRKVSTALIIVLSTILLGSCNQSSINVPEKNVELISLGFEASPSDGTLKLINVDGRDISGLNTQATLSSTELAFAFENVQFPVNGEMTVDFKFDNKTIANGWQNMTVKHIDGTIPLLPNATGANYSYSVNGNSGLVDIGKSVALASYTGIAPTADTGNDDFMGSDAFTLAFDVDYIHVPGAKFQFFIDLIADAVPNNVVAFDLVGGASFNRNSLTLIPTTGNPRFPSSKGDNFGIQFTTDDSNDNSSGTASNPNNVFFIDPSSIYEPFFLSRDVDNSDYDLDPPALQATPTATWDFDILGHTDLELSIDFAAKGDFEATSLTPRSNDVFTLTYQIDGGVEQTLISFQINEGTDLTYTLFDTTTAGLDDPLEISTDGVNFSIQNNIFKTYSKQIVGTGSSLSLKFTATNDIGSELIAIRNIVITGN